MPNFKLVITYSPYFVKNFRKLPLSVQRTAISQEKLFRKNMYAPSLKTHKLKGDLVGYYAFSVNYHYRILFVIEPNNEVVFINIGTHSIYR